MRRLASPTPAPFPTAVMRSPSTATSARLGGAPVPSTTVAPAITRSWGMAHLSDGGKDLSDESLLGAAGLVLLGVHGRADDDEPVDTQSGELAEAADAVLGRPHDAETVDEVGGQAGRLGRAGAGVLVHVVAVVDLVQHALGRGVDGAAHGAVHGREAGEGGQPAGPE